jgi:formylglycine-generating enzyme required for sulfatase activity
MKFLKGILAVAMLAVFAGDAHAVWNTFVTVTGGTFGNGTNFKGQTVATARMGETEVNFTEWQGVRTYAAANGFDIGAVGTGKSATAPVENVDWYDALKWCNAATLQQGTLTPVYSVGTLAITALSSSGTVATATVPGGHKLSTGNWVTVSGASVAGYNLTRSVTVTSPTAFRYLTVSGSMAVATTASAKVWYTTGEVVPTVEAAGTGYRLPTEKEWEWAAWGGLSSGTYTYSGSNTANTVAWTRENQPSLNAGAQPVRTKTANELSLYDMSGNVAEWCFDDAVPLYGRRVRGGGWSSDAGLSRTMNRGYRDPAKAEAAFGFRAARNN